MFFYKYFFKLLPLTGLIFSAVSGLAQDQEITVEKRHSVKSNPFYSLAGWLPVTYELFISNNKSIVLGASYITNEPPAFSTFGNTYSTRSGFYLNPAFRFYLFKSSNLPGGFYASPEVGYIRQNKRLNGDSVSLYDLPDQNGRTGPPFTVYLPEKELIHNEIQIGATIGYQFVIKEVFVLDVYAGEGLGIIQFGGDADAYYYHLNAVRNRDKDPPKTGSRLLAGFKVGIAF